MDVILGGTSRRALGLAAVLTVGAACAHTTAPKQVDPEAAAVVDGTPIARRDADDVGLQTLIDRVLIRAEAKRLGITAGPADVDRVVGHLADGEAVTPDQLRQSVEQQGRYRSWADYRESLRDELLMLEIVMRDPQADVPEDEVRGIYDEMVRGMTGEEIPRYAHVRQEIRRQLESQVFARIEAETLARLRRQADIRILEEQQRH